MPSAPGGTGSGSKIAGGTPPDGNVTNMSEHRFRQQLSSRRPVAVASPAPAAAAVAFMSVPAQSPVHAAMAEVYRLAYEAAIARIAARRRCFAPFSLN